MKERIHKIVVDDEEMDAVERDPTEEEQAKAKLLLEKFGLAGYSVTAVFQAVDEEE